jgi:hypothetical protein
MTFTDNLLNTASKLIGVVLTVSWHRSYLLGTGTDEGELFGGAGVFFTVVVLVGIILILEKW